LSTKADPDLWGHVRFGLDILRDHALPRHDPYSFTQDVPWVNHEWGSEALFAGAYQIGGVTGLVMLKALLVTLPLLIVWRALRGYATVARSGALVLVAWSALPLTGTVRPQLWSWLAAAALLVVLRTRWRWTVPLLFAAWANLHGGWIVGLGLLAAWTLHEAVATSAARPLLLVLLSLAATLLTPYGVTLWSFLAATVRVGRPAIQEWQPLWTAPTIVWVPWLLAAGAFAWAAWRRRLSWPLVLGCVGLALASGRVIRLVPFFVLATVLWGAPLPVPRASARGWWLEALAAGVVAIYAIVALAPMARCLRADPSWAPDVRVALDGSTGTLAVPFDWGEYAIWRWGPRLQVSLDGRRETVYSDAVVAPQMALARNDPSGLPFLAAARPDLVWYPQTFTRARTWLLGQGYRVVLETPESFVMLRPGAVVHANVRTSIPTCFPYD
jgi:hypothetical protein